MSDRATLSCEEFVDLAAAVARDAADDDDARRVEDHARTCRRCRAWLDEFRTTAAAMGAAVPLVEPPASLRARVLESVRQEPRPLPFARRPRFSLAWLAAAASFIIAIGALAWVPCCKLRSAISRIRSRLQVIGRLASIAWSTSSRLTSCR